MKRLAWSFAVAVAVAGCGGSTASDTTTTPAAGAGQAEVEPEPTVAGEGETATDEPVEYQEIDLPAATSFLPLLKVGANGIGCALVAEETDGLAYQCEEGLIFMVQKGAKLRYACETAPPDRCGALMQRITEKMLQAAGG